MRALKLGANTVAPVIGGLLVKVAENKVMGWIGRGAAGAVVAKVSTASAAPAPPAAPSIIVIIADAVF